MTDRVFNPEACAHGYTYGQYCPAYGKHGGAVDEAHIQERGQTHGQTNREAAERWLGLTDDPGALAQGYAALALLDYLDAVTAAVNATLPGVVGTLDAVGKALSGQMAAQTAALQRIAAALEPREEVRVVGDTEASPSRECQAHGAHPHGGRRCLDCPECASRGHQPVVD